VTSYKVHGNHLDNIHTQTHTARESERDTYGETYQPTEGTDCQRRVSTNVPRQLSYNSKQWPDCQSLSEIFTAQNSLA